MGMVLATHGYGLDVMGMVLATHEYGLDVMGMVLATHGYGLDLMGMVLATHHGYGLDLMGMHYAPNLLPPLEHWVPFTLFKNNYKDVLSFPDKSPVHYLHLWEFYLSTLQTCPNLFM
jgi:hypothetical protein